MTLKTENLNKTIHKIEAALSLEIDEFAAAFDRSFLDESMCGHTECEDCSFSKSHIEDSAFTCLVCIPCNKITSALEEGNEFIARVIAVQFLATLKEDNNEYVTGD